MRASIILALYHFTIAALFVIGAAYLVAGVCYALAQATLAVMP